MTRALLVTLLLALPVHGQAILPTVPTPEPPPVPKPVPWAAVTLTSDLVYVVRSDQPMIVLASPDGVLTIDAQSGPQTVRGRFVDNPNKTVTRKFTEKYLYFVEPATSGRVELLVVPSGATDARSVQRRLIDAQMGPRPPPVPPDPVPPVPPGPVPVPSDKLRVLLLHETAQTLPPGPTGVLFSTIPQKAVQAAGGDYARWDKDVDLNVPGVNQFWKDAIKRPRASLPWLIIGSPKGYYEGPLPASVADFMARIKQYGG